MSSEEMTHLQRIGEGLPLLARIENGILHLSTLDQPDRTWEEFPVESGTGAYDATLEAFCRGERLGAGAVLKAGARKLLEDSETTVRLVLNNREDGNPTVLPDWKVQGLAVVSRPTLSRSEGKGSWTLARSLPCPEIRIYRQAENGAWIVERDTWESFRSESDPSRRLRAKEDRYTAASQSLPRRPLAKPFAIRSIGRAERDASMKSYRM